MQVEPPAIMEINSAEKTQRQKAFTTTAFHYVYKVYEYNTIEKRLKHVFFKEPNTDFKGFYRLYFSIF
jgi:hypothetical protein